MFDFATTTESSKVCPQSCKAEYLMNCQYFMQLDSDSLMIFLSRMNLLQLAGALLYEPELFTMDSLGFELMMCSILGCVFAMRATHRTGFMSLDQWSRELSCQLKYYSPDYGSS